ncbi:MAG: 1-acyl-sn-glycerol-3-phosphate acyltransferase [Alphaproteobacteria bacterium]|nr:1-acyl-sn-glycerol-3-phosphate acyltransferase [Alphaproteobacteria bacterium]MBU0859057.1 1-acyl-sn-glycerol-3-phosphate acyltransferase [Alphaproteobacteria bacterium]
MPRLRLILRLFLFTLICLLITIIQWPMLRIYRGPKSFIAARWWQIAAARIFGVTVRVHGTPYESGQTLYVANHISYIDIPALGSIIKGVFIARADLAGWPVFGFLGKLQQTAYISRDKKNARAEKENLERLVREGKNLILFAEGTSTDGTLVLPFKSSLFSLAFNDDGTARNVMIQPVTIALVSVDGQPVEPGAGPLRDSYTWHGDMTLGAHILARARALGAVVDITFHPPRNPAAYNGDRKALATDCYNDVVHAMPVLTRAA